MSDGQDRTLDVLRETAIEPARPRTSWTATELLEVELPAPRWAVDGLIPEGLTFLAGSPKLGKSWLALGLGIAIAAGGHALATIPVDQGEVLYMALEDNARRLQSRLRMVLNGAAPPEGLFLELTWPRLDEGGLQQLAQWLNEHPNARLVIVDVYTRIRPRSRNGDQRDRYAADYETASTLQALAVNHGVAIVVLYHTRKAEAEDFVETVQGTFGTAAAADTIAVVKRARGEADATLSVTGRDVVEQELALRFAPEAGTWALLGDAAEYALGETRKQILDAIVAHGELTPKQVSEHTGIDHEKAKKAMQRMFHDGQLKANRGRYSLPEGQTPVPAVPVSLFPANDGFSSGTPVGTDETGQGQDDDEVSLSESADFQAIGTEGHEGHTAEGRLIDEDIPLGDEPVFEPVEDSGELSPLPSWRVEEATL